MQLIYILDSKNDLDSDLEKDFVDTDNDQDVEEQCHHQLSAK